MPRYARLTLIAVGALSLNLGTLSQADDNDVPAETIPQSLLLEFLADNSRFTLLDARTPAEYEKSHIAGAVNVPHDSVDELTPQVPEKRDELLVVYCKTGKRAALLQAELRNRGYTDVHVLKPDRIIWFDDMAVFNCATPSSEKSASELTSQLVSGNKEKSK